jgi:hypothetical protein
MLELLVIVFESLSQFIVELVRAALDHFLLGGDAVGHFSVFGVRAWGIYLGSSCSRKLQQIQTVLCTSAVEFTFFSRG